MLLIIIVCVIKWWGLVFKRKDNTTQKEEVTKPFVKSNFNGFLNWSLVCFKNNIFVTIKFVHRTSDIVHYTFQNSYFKLTSLLPFIWLDEIFILLFTFQLRYESMKGDARFCFKLLVIFPFETCFNSLQLLLFAEQRSL